ncbi:MAG: hypothetical protein M9945_14105 [Aquamicrobium sp.]|uniref:protein-tyrosine phosphatase family protein n=1 Tax=Aquamicrobium sp. TaxID=1872579 RepID=UPI00349EE46A|nr:hypothetical protein [Aquamicrobium sp.]
MNMNARNVPSGANGILPITLGARHAWMKFELVGGPFDRYPTVKGVNFGVCVRAERVPARGVAVHLPIHDFAVPQDDGQVRYALKDTLEAALAGKSVYVGCAGGWGRTGLFLALIAKTAGVEDPIDYVRRSYTPRAVETKEQEAYVEDFDVAELRKWMVRAAWRARFRRLLG